MPKVMATNINSKKSNWLERRQEVEEEEDVEGEAEGETE